MKHLSLEINLSGKEETIPSPGRNRGEGNTDKFFIQAYRQWMRWVRPVFLLSLPILIYEQ